MESEGSSLYSQTSTIGKFPEPDEPNQKIDALFL